MPGGAEIEAAPDVVKIWSDGRIAPFGGLTEDVAVLGLDLPRRGDAPAFEVLEGMAACPIGTCDCSPGTPKGTIADVASYLGVDQIWAAGHKGEGIVVGVVDGGIRAAGRPIKPGEGGPTARPRHRRLADRELGNDGRAWGDHGMMCWTDVLGMAPKAQIYDMRISDGDALSDALQASSGRSISTPPTGRRRC